MKINNSILNLISMLLKRKQFIEQTQSPFYHSYTNESEKAVDRVSYLINAAKGKRVLHFGFLDSPFLADMLTNKQLLHSKLAEVSDYLFGIDINQDDLELYRKLTGDFNNAVLNIEEEKNFPDYLSNNFDLILFPEVLEHISNPGLATEGLSKISKINNDCQVILTVPNAFSIYGFINSIYAIESVHQDHVAYYSPYTIKNLLTRAGFIEIQIQFYARKIEKSTPGITKTGVIAICN